MRAGGEHPAAAPSPGEGGAASLPLTPGGGIDGSVGEAAAAGDADGSGASLESPGTGGAAVRVSAAGGHRQHPAMGVGTYVGNGNGYRHSSANGGGGGNGSGDGNGNGHYATSAVATPLEVLASPLGGKPTVWGLDPVQLHDRFWAHRGVQVVRPGEAAPLSDQAQLYLLMDERVLATFESGAQLETLYWSSPDLVYVRVHDARDRGYRERVVTDEADRFVRFERIYPRPVPRLMRAAFTPDRGIAAAWQASADGRVGWPALRRRVPRRRRSTIVTDGTMYDRSSDADLARLVRDLARLWVGLGATVPRARQAAAGVWADADVRVDPAAKFAGPVWVGAGRVVDPQTTLIGPFVMWDDPAARPAAGPVVWPATRHIDLPRVHRPVDALTINAKRVHAAAKRGFDVCFSLLAIALTFWLYPVVALAIWLEDGRPIFFGHRRETTGGREFSCWKFRSMYRDAERRKQELLAQGKNQADGPQFFMEKDVRVTRVGRLLRKSRLDELPQFFNVLLGHMSVVGPRPSPFKENQFCPAWREARLSVRPGITGLWQVKRTREAGNDFQEWIKYDIEYVEHASFSLDMVIIFRTVVSVIAGVLPKRGKK